MTAPDTSRWEWENEDVLVAILPYLERSADPSADWPDGEGKYHAVCPFKDHPEDCWFEVSRDSLQGSSSLTLDLTGSAWAVSILGDPVVVTKRLTVTVQDGTTTDDPILSVGIVGDIGYFRGQRDLLGRPVDRDPMRFLGLETVTVTATLSRTPDLVVFQPVGPLLAYSFQDPFGNFYLLSRLGRKTNPLQSEFAVVPAAGQTTVSFRYMLPLLPSTVSWDGRVLRAPYRFRVRAEQDGRVWTREETGIGITGDVFDVLYLQPSS